MAIERLRDESSPVSEEAQGMTALLREAAASAVRVQEAVARSAGVNPTDLQAVELLLREGPLTPGELAERRGLTAGGAVTTLVDRLQKARLATRRRHPRDRRKVVVAARTELARERIGPVPERAERRWAAYLDTLTADELAFAHELLAEAIRINRDAVAELEGLTPSGAASSSPPPGGAPRAPAGADGARGARPPTPR